MQAEASAHAWAEPRAAAVAEAAALLQRVYGVISGARAAAQWRPKRFAGCAGRYLWTDAWGVVGCITVAQETGDAAWLAAADALIADVHDVLGRGRDGALLGTPAAPLSGGLRIGKAAKEGTSDGDGQYFHYITKRAAVPARAAADTSSASGALRARAGGHSR